MDREAGSPLDAYSASTSSVPADACNLTSSVATGQTDGEYLEGEAFTPPSHPQRRHRPGGREASDDEPVPLPPPLNPSVSRALTDGDCSDDELVITELVM